jgi:hypothetical protein
MSRSFSLRPRRETLEEVNRLITKECPWFVPIADERELGMCSKGEIEIIAVAQVVADLWHAFAHVQFTTIQPDGSFKPYTVRIDKPAALVYAVINGKLLLSYQSRLAIGSKWTLELPRGWVSPEDARTPESAVRALLTRECGSAFVASLSSFRPVEVKRIWQDTGTMRSDLPVYYLEAESVLIPLERQGVCKPKLYGFGEADELEEKGKLNDALSLAGLRVVERYLQRTVRL